MVLGMAAPPSKGRLRLALAKLRAAAA